MNKRTIILESNEWYRLSHIRKAPVKDVVINELKHKAPFEIDLKTLTFDGKTAMAHEL